MFSVLCAFCMSACSDDSNVDDTTLVIDVPVITDITFNSAEVKAVIKDAEFVERGVCYSTFKNPNMLNNKIVSGDATDEFSVVLKDLSSNTKYYVRSYAVCKITVWYILKLLISVLWQMRMTSYLGNILLLCIRIIIWQ